MKKGRTDIWQAGNGALGLETSLLVMLTIVRGTVVAENGEVVGQPGPRQDGAAYQVRK